MAATEPDEQVLVDLMTELESLTRDLWRLCAYLEALVAARAPERRN